MTANPTPKVETGGTTASGLPGIVRTGGRIAASAALGAAMLLTVPGFQSQARAQSVPQVCSGSFVRDFGASATPVITLPAGVTTTYDPYAPVDGGMNDGQLALVSTPDLVDDFGGAFNDQWHDSADNTGNPDGLMLMVNAANGTQEFYRETFSGLIVGATYSFSAFVANALPIDTNPTGTDPNIRLSIEGAGGGAILATTDTGLIPQTSRAVGMQWLEQTLTFTATATSHDLVLTNLVATGGATGNDVAFDDISLTLFCDGSDASGGYGAAQHVIMSGIGIGAGLDGEATVQFSADADGDDTDGSDDEDGITVSDLIGGNTEYTIPAANISASATSGATLHAWVDFDSSGTFSAGEYTSVPVAAGGPTGPLSWTGLTGVTATPGTTFARFRLTSDAAIGAGTPTGSASDGEVEDYPVTIIAQTPELTVTKSVTSTGPLQTDGTFDVAFRVDVVNTGNVTLTSPTLVDDLEAEFADLFVPSSAATATGGVIVAPVLSGVTGAPGISANADFDGDGDDSLIDTTGTAALAPGDQFSVSFTVTLDATQTAPTPTDNQATAGGTPPGGGAPVTDVSQDSPTPGTAGSTPTPVAVPVVPATELGVVKTAALDITGGADSAALDAGDTIAYTYTVINPAGAALNILDITITEVTTGATAFTGTNGAPTPVSNDDGSTLGGAGTLNDLAPGDSMTFSAIYTLSQADIDAGSVTNSAIASGSDPGGNPVTDVSDESSPAPGNDDPTVVPLTAVSDLRATLTAGTPTTAGGTNRSFTDPGDTIPYTLTVTNTGDTTLDGLSVDSTTGLTVGACTPTTLAPGEQATCVVTDYVIQSSDIAAGGVEQSVTATATGPGGTTVSDVSDTGNGSESANDSVLFSTVDGDPTNDPTIVPLFAVDADETPLFATKSVNQSSVLYGASVVFTLSFQNLTDQPLNDVVLHDRLPSGLIYTPGSATVNGTAREPEIGSTLSWDGITIPAEGTVVVTIAARVVADEAGAELVNVTFATDPGGLALSNRANATVYQRIEQIFDCTDVIGKVYDDRNQNGYQDQGEPGLAGVRIATVRGELITTDQYGRYHVPCQALPAEIGSNIILKVDTRSLPSGYRMTTENPRVMRATAGKMVRVNFGAAISTVIRLDLDANAFTGRSALIQPLQDALNGLVAQYGSAPATLRLRYHLGVDSRQTGRRNLKAVEAYMRKAWRSHSKHQLTIEREMN